MDLQVLESRETANSGAVLTLVHPVTLEPLLDDDDQQMWIRLAGEDSDRYQQATLAVSDRRLQVAFEHRGGLRVHATDLEQEALLRLAKCTLAWHVQLDGQLLACTEAEAKKLYTRFPWIREQVDKFIADRRNFFQPWNSH